MQSRVVISADIHGLYPAWGKLLRFLDKQTDILVIAGDLFDNRYGDKSNPHFQPDTILKELLALEIPYYYVYGNCDLPSFAPQFDYSTTFNFMEQRCLVFHGDTTYDYSNADIVISGHTHKPVITWEEEKLIINPGSPSKPRVGIPTIATLTKEGASLLKFS